MSKKDKTLREVLEQGIYQKVNVKVGSKQGSSFFYCGKGKYAVFEISKKIQKEMKAQIAQQKRNLENRLLNLDKIYQEKKESALKDGKIKNVAEYIKALDKSYKKEKQKLPLDIVAREWELSVPLLDRPVEEVVMGISPDEYPCKIIYIKGHELGKYWTIAEYVGKEKLHKEDEEQEEE